MRSIMFSNMADSSNAGHRVLVSRPGHARPIQRLGLPAPPRRDADALSKKERRRKRQRRRSHVRLAGTLRRFSSMRVSELSLLLLDLHLLLDHDLLSVLERDHLLAGPVSGNVLDAALDTRVLGRDPADFSSRRHVPTPGDPGPAGGAIVPEARDPDVGRSRTRRLDDHLLLGRWRL